MTKPQEKSFRILLYKTIIALSQLFVIGIIVLAVIFLLPLAVPYIKDARSFHYIRIALNIERAVSLFVENNVPTNIGGKDLTRWIVLVAAFFLFRFFAGLRERYRNKIKAAGDQVQTLEEYEKGR